METYWKVVIDFYDPTSFHMDIGLHVLLLKKTKKKTRIRDSEKHGDRSSEMIVLTFEDGTGAEETKTAKMANGKVNLTNCMFAVERD